MRKKLPAFFSHEVAIVEAQPDLSNISASRAECQILSKQNAILLALMAEAQSKFEHFQDAA